MGSSESGEPHQANDMCAHLKLPLLKGLSPDGFKVSGIKVRRGHCSMDG
jgi:hypothetical protein